VAHIYNPSYLEGWIGRIAVEGQLGQIVHKTSSPKSPKENGLGGMAQMAELLTAL
jgi:hypothetical protein